MSMSLFIRGKNRTIHGTTLIKQGQLRDPYPVHLGEQTPVQSYEQTPPPNILILLASYFAPSYDLYRWLRRQLQRGERPSQQAIHAKADPEGQRK